MQIDEKLPRIVVTNRGQQMVKHIDNTLWTLEDYNKTFLNKEMLQRELISLLEEKINRLELKKKLEMANLDKARKELEKMLKNDENIL